MSGKFPRPMFEAVTEKFEDEVHAFVTCNKCGQRLQPIKLRRTRDVPWDVIKLRIWGLADHHHTCNPLAIPNIDPGAGDRVVNIYHEKKREQEKVGAPSFLDQAIKKTLKGLPLLGTTPGNA